MKYTKLRVDFINALKKEILKRGGNLLYTGCRKPQNTDTFINFELGGYIYYAQLNDNFLMGNYASKKPMLKPNPIYVNKADYEALEVYIDDINIMQSYAYRVAKAKYNEDFTEMAKQCLSELENSPPSKIARNARLLKYYIYKKEKE